MDQIEKVAETHEFRTFIRKWGSAVSIRIAGDDVIELTTRDPEAGTAVRLATFTKVIARGHPSFSSRVHPQNGKFWVWEKDILHATEMYGTNAKLQKFSWNPQTGDFYFVPVGQQHATVHMAAPFDDYVRGIILPTRNLVTLRPVWPSWAQKPGWYSDEEVKEISFEAQHACKRALELNGSTGWEWRLNISNQDLEDLTGIHRW